MGIWLWIIIAVVVVALVLLIILNVSRRKNVLKELGLDDSFFNFCNINSVVHYGRPSVFDVVNGKYVNHQMFCVKDGEVYMVPYTSSKAKSIKNVVKFKTSDIVSCEKLKRVLNLSYYRITLNTSDVLDLMFAILTDERDAEMEKLLK